jgi:signal transduction histidine kinase
MQHYADVVANKIYRFSNSAESEFYFPRSSIFESGIFENNGKKTFSLLSHDIYGMTAGSSTDQNGYLYLRSNLKDNIFGADYLVVAKKIAHTKLMQNVLAILIVTAVLVFLMLLVIIRQSAEPYKKFNSYMENFIKDAMHEMKTPLGVILLNLDGLSSMYKNNTMIRRAKSALKNMMVVYDDLEFFVRNSRVEHTKQKIDLSSFCRERVGFFSDLLHSKEIKIVEDIDDGIELVFSTLELSRIIDNTLSNAIKYSKNGTTIHFSLKSDDDHILLSVKDQGRGVEDASKIFDRYYRGDKISGGFGIGLNIVKTICDQNGVDIEVHSETGSGSEFIFIFPISYEN